MEFNEKIVKLRKMKKLTQDEFAKAVGVTRQAVYKWESGQSYPEAAKLVEMKKLFEVSIDNLLDPAYEVVVPEKPKRRRRVAPLPEMAAAPAPAEEAPAPVQAEAAPADSAKAEEKKKKKGLFGRLFG